MKSKSLANSGKQFLVAAAVALATGLAIPQAASATNDEVVTCGLKTLRGVYHFSASGFNIVNGAAVPKAIIETIVLDGRGGVLTPAADGERQRIPHPAAAGKSRCLHRGR